MRSELREVGVLALRSSLLTASTPTSYFYEDRILIFLQRRRRFAAS